MSILKRKPYRNQKIRDAARGEACTLQFNGCRNEMDTVVACHNPDSDAGMGQKGDDFEVAFGCRFCHDLLDCRTYPDSGGMLDHLRREHFHRGMIKTLRILFERGILK